MTMPQARAAFTVRQKILLAAVALAEGGAAFTTEDLVVRAWELFPESFALRGCARFPDSNRVLAKLSGRDGLCGLGWFQHTAQRTYRVTRKGRAMATHLRSPASRSATRARAASVAHTPARPARDRAPAAAPPRPVRSLPPEDVAAILALARCPALQKFQRGSPLTFADACLFWAISRTTDPDAVQARVEAIAALLARVVETFAGEGAPDPRLPPLATCFGLLNLHHLMRGRFAGELAALTARSGA